MPEYLQSLIASTTGASDITSVLISIAIALATGLVISLLYILTNRKDYSQSLAITLVFMPAIISTIIMMVGENIAAAFSLAGIFTIIRFRSAPGSAKDILLILFCVGAGLAYGMQLYLYGIAFTTIMAIVQLVLHRVHYAKTQLEQLQLKIVSPDSANNEATFAKVIDKYVKSFELERIGTRDLGSVYELVYNIELSRGQERKSMIDELRLHNSNMNITINNRTNGSLF